MSYDKKVVLEKYYLFIVTKIHNRKRQEEIMKSKRIIGILIVYLFVSVFSYAGTIKAEETTDFSMRVADVEKLLAEAKS